MSSITDIRHKEIRGITYGLMAVMIGCTATIVISSGKYYTKAVQYVERKNATDDAQNKALELLSKNDDKIEASQAEAWKAINKNTSDIFDVANGRQPVFTAKVNH